MAMAMESHPRTSRQTVPGDVVSCPPSLSLQRTSKKSAKIFAPEIKEMSRPLSGIEEIDTDESMSVLSARFQSEISSLGTNDAPSAYARAAYETSRAAGAKANAVLEKPVLRQFKTSTNRLSRNNLPWPLSENGRSTSGQQRDWPQLHETLDGSSTRPHTRQQRQHHEEHTHNTSARPRNQIRSAVHSSVRSSMNSSMVSWDTMSHSMYSVYSTASMIVRRPVWGHYVVGFLVFSGWILHHWFFSEYFLRSMYVSNARGGLGATATTIAFDDSKPSMLRGAVRGDTAVYRTIDVENRHDYVPVKSVAGAFDVFEGERPGVVDAEIMNDKSNSTLNGTEGSAVTTDGAG